MDGIGRLVGEAQDLVGRWERAPLLSRDLGGFDDVFSVRTAQHLVATGLPAASARLFRDGVALPAGLVERSGARRGRSGVRLVEGIAVMRHVADGATLVIEQVQLYVSTVAAFAAAVARESGYDVDCTAFLTPVGAGGVAAHTDPVSVFLRQVHGSKRWRVWSPEPTAPDDPPLLDVELRTGDCLYIPRGFRHAGETRHEPSVHLSLSVSGPTWGEVLSRMAAAVGEDVEQLREVVPPRFAPRSAGELLPERLAVLAARLAAMPMPPLAAGDRSDGGAVAASGADLVAALARPGRSARRGA